MDITPFFRLMVDKNASDLFFSVGAPPHIKIEGKIAPVGQTVLKSKQMNLLVNSLLSDEQQNDFEKNFELNMGISLENIGRFRANFFRQKGEKAIVIRYIREEILSIEKLNLPKILESIIMEVRGLVLVVGSTSSGKSTTLASMINFRNENHRSHILTIEDPIEYMHHHKKSIVDQREVGLDTHTFASALKNALREAPDVILIGEIRDKDTMKHAIAYAETGHLCLSTLHANNANQALERVINFFPTESKQHLLSDLSRNLKAIISLRLIPGVKNQRVPAVEILLNSPYISNLIENGKFDEIKEVMERNREMGMQTFDQTLLDLYFSEHITKENAIRYADSKNNVSIKIRLSEKGEELGKNSEMRVEDDKEK